MKIQKKHRNAGRLLMASGIMFFIASYLSGQPALIGAGAALFGVGLAIFLKRETAS